ncbi:uncharacterized protein LOC134541614 [Bacillus rossius redtenbacheri]|uniref:uncharacterized protein LOC134541614 n=1 Tax=Bacillus rossius redtenbacheri TaxID=93214 RepID=UPI002FDD56B3
MTQPTSKPANTANQRAVHPNLHANGQRDRSPWCQYCHEEAYHLHEKCPTRTTLWQDRRPGVTPPGNAKPGGGTTHHPSAPRTESSTCDGTSPASPTPLAPPAGPDCTPSPPIIPGGGATHHPKAPCTRSSACIAAPLADPTSPAPPVGPDRVPSPPVIPGGGVTHHPKAPCTGSSACDATPLAPPASPAPPAGPDHAPSPQLGQAGNNVEMLMRVPVLLNGQPVHPTGGHRGEPHVWIAVRDMCSRTTALVVPELRNDLILGLPWLILEDAAIDVS